MTLPGGSNVEFGKRAQGFVDTRLDTWKSIAQHLGRSSRTVQRWHSGYGLPVHHLGGDATSVYAYADELDLWLRRRGGLLPGNVPAKDPAPPVTSQEKPGQFAEREQQQFSTSAEQKARELVAGAQKLWETLSASNLTTIAGMYRRATDLDASNSLAYAGLSQALIAQSVLGNLHPSGALHAAKAALKRAIEIDPEVFEGLCASAMLNIFVYRDWEGAEAQLDDALALHPKATQALVGCAFLAIARGRLEEACHTLRIAAIERPLNTSIAELLCWVEYLNGRFDSATALVGEARESGHSGAILDTVEGLCGIGLAGPESQIERLEAVNAASGRNYTLLGVLGYAYAKTGKRDAARQVIESMRRICLTGVYDFAYPIALTFVGMGEKEEARRWLEQSFRYGSLWSIGFGSDPFLVELRKDASAHGLFGPMNYPIGCRNGVTNRDSELARTCALFKA